MAESNKLNGFTIVELLIVIVVLGILATITMTAYNGIQKRALNTGRLVEFQAWQKNFELYKTFNGSYPSMPNGNYCLGNDFPNGTCGNWDQTGSYSYPQANSTPLLTQLATVASHPASQRTPANTRIGPYVTYDNSARTITFTTFFSDKPGTCPPKTSQVWFGDGDTIMCSITYPF